MAPVGVRGYLVPHPVFLCVPPSHLHPPHMTQHPLLSQEGWREWGSVSGGQRAPPTRVRVLGGQAETAGADRQHRPRPGWRGKGKRCTKGVVFIARSGGRNPIRALSWEVLERLQWESRRRTQVQMAFPPALCSKAGFLKGLLAGSTSFSGYLEIVVPHPAPTRHLVVGREARRSYRPGCCRG